MLARQLTARQSSFASLKIRSIISSIRSFFIPFRQVTGTGNVCERAALAGAGVGGRLVVRKRAENGVTVAVAQAEWDRQYGRRGVE